ncbi:MAG: hypothetical protein ACJBCI_05885 [Candidatus Tisiphia sp.]
MSAIVGIAPYARDSGNKQGRRFIRGGRKIHEMLYTWRYWRGKMVSKIVFNI